MKTINEIFEYDPTVPSCIRRNGKIVNGPTAFVKKTTTKIPNHYLRVEEIVWLLFGNKITDGTRVVKKYRNCSNKIENLELVVIEHCRSANLTKHLKVSSESCSGLKWASHVILHPNLTISHYPNEDAGHIDGRGYFTILFMGKTYKVHRIIWEIAFGEIPDGYIVDHIDGNKQNNILCNLRCIPSAQNARNASHPNKSESGVIGVHTYKRDGELFGYRVGWQDWSTGKPKGMLKYFYFKEHGDSAFDKACEFRQYKISELNSLGYGYTTRHGYRETNNEDSN